MYNKGVMHSQATIEHECAHIMQITIFFRTLTHNEDPILLVAIIVDDSSKKDYENVILGILSVRALKSMWKKKKKKKKKFF